MVLVAVVCGLVLWFVIGSMQSTKDQSASDTTHKVTYKDYDGKKIGIATGTNLEAESFPEELSGGQQQRAAIARALAMKPQILLLDEPTSALDPTNVAEVLTVIRSLARSGMTMLIVTHEMRFARNVSNRVFYMDEGGIYEEGTPEEVFDSPRREKTRRFIRHLKTLELSIRARRSTTRHSLQRSSALERMPPSPPRSYAASCSRSKKPCPKAYCPPCTRADAACRLRF